MVTAAVTAAQTTSVVMDIHIVHHMFVFREDYSVESRMLSLSWAVEDRKTCCVSTHFRQSLACMPVLQTNNPRKINLLRSLGVIVTERIPCIVKAQALNKHYLATKQQRMQHDLYDELDGSFCYWNHGGETLSVSHEIDSNLSSMDFADAATTDCGASDNTS